MLTESRAKTRATRKLKNGLHLEIINNQSEVTIILWRDTVHPSIAEWDTVMRNFPYNTPKIVPAPVVEGSRYCIKGTVPTQRAAQLKFG